MLADVGDSTVNMVPQRRGIRSIRVNRHDAAWASRWRISIAALDIKPAELLDRTERSALLARVRRAWPALLAICLLIALWAGSNRVPADPTEPLSLEGHIRSARLSGRTLRVGSFNIHSGKGIDGEVNLDRTAKFLGDLDIVGLYEVRGTVPMFRENQAQTLGQKLKMAWLFAPTERRWWHNHFGNALLTSIDLDGFQQIPLPATRDKAFRGALLVSFPFDGRQVRMLLTHIDTAQDREQQLRAVIHLFLSLEKPAILIGDLNTTRRDPQLRELLAMSDVRDALAQTSNDPKDAGHIDWILTRGLRRVASQRQPTDASDHPVVWAELELDSPLHQADRITKPGIR